MDKLLTVREFADIMSVSQGTVRFWIAKGMPLVTMNPHRIDYEAAIKWLNHRGKNNGS